MEAKAILSALRGRRFHLENEKQLQGEISEAFFDAGIDHVREYRLSGKDIPDFFIHSQGIVIEVKIKGRPREIFRQCERYASYMEVRSIIVLTNKSMGFPKEIFGKPIYVIKLSYAWL